MKRLLVVMMAIAGMAAIAATPTVSNVTAKQRFPWNGLVDIFCTVSGIDGTTNGLKFVVAAVMPDSSDVNKVSHFWVVENGTNSASHKVHADGDYRLLWNAQADLGTVIYSNMVVRVSVVDVHGKVQLWEGGPYWADTNIGAEEPWEYGYYFWWGDTVGYKRENNSWVASDGSSSDFSFEEANTPTDDKWDNSLKREGWITSDNILAPEHDAAHVQWGGEWRMPTNQELSDLTNMCDWIWTTVNDVKGYILVAKELMHLPVFSFLPPGQPSINMLLIFLPVCVLIGHLFPAGTQITDTEPGNLTFGKIMKNILLRSTPSAGKGSQFAPSKISLN